MSVTLQEVQLGWGSPSRCQQQGWPGWSLLYFRVFLCIFLFASTLSVGGGLTIWALYLLCCCVVVLCMCSLVDVVQVQATRVAGFTQKAVQRDLDTSTSSMSPNNGSAPLCSALLVLAQGDPVDPPVRSSHLSPSLDSDPLLPQRNVTYCTLYKEWSFYSAPCHFVRLHRNETVL